MALWPNLSVSCPDMSILYNGWEFGRELPPGVDIIQKNIWETGDGIQPTPKTFFSGLHKKTQEKCKNIFLISSPKLKKT